MSDFDAYIEHLDPIQREHLERIRDIVKAELPSCEETISYAIPTLKYKGKNLIHFAAFKNHMSIFPTASPIAELKDALKDFTTAKGTIHFTADRPVPDNLIIELIELRRKAIDKD